MDSNEKLTENQLYNLFDSWCQNMTEDDGCLTEKIERFEEDYFEDMLFKPNSICYYIFQFEIMGYSFDLESNYYRFFVVDCLEDNAFGQTNHNDRTISIIARHKNDSATILHEMIHAHEQIIKDFKYRIFSENLLLQLYNKLSHKIENLDDIIKSHSEFIHQSDMAVNSGEHGLLFLLKSLDLDIRFGFPLGTVFGYGYDDAGNVVLKANAEKIK